MSDPAEPDHQGRLDAELAAAQAVSHPLRFRIFMALTKCAATVKTVGAELGEQPTKLYYHVKILEEHGLIRVVSTRLVSGIVEKEYEAVPGRYRLPAPAAEDGSVYAAVLADAFRDLAASLDADESSPLKPDERPLFHWWTGDLTPVRRRELRRRLVRLVRDLGGTTPETPSDGDTYGVVLALYPVEPHPA